MGRLHRQGEATVRSRAAARHLEQRGVDHAMFQAAGQNAIARGPGRSGGAVGAAALRRLRDCHQQRSFRGAELARLLAEIGERRGTYAFQIAAHRRQRQVDRQYLALGIAPFELQRAGGLDGLRREAPGPGIEQASGLHRDGGRT